MMVEDPAFAMEEGENQGGHSLNLDEMSLLLFDWLIWWIRRLLCCFVHYLSKLGLKLNESHNLFLFVSHLFFSFDLNGYIKLDLCWNFSL